MYVYVKSLVIPFLIVAFHSKSFSIDTLRYTSPNARYNCIVINSTKQVSFSSDFIEQLFQCKAASEYDLHDSFIILDKKDTVKLPTFQLHIQEPYVSAQVCIRQRNYVLSFKTLECDSYKATLDILTDHKIKSQATFTLTLQAKPLLYKGVYIYKEKTSNFSVMVQAEDTLVVEHLFIDNHPCPRTILFHK